MHELTVTNTLVQMVLSECQQKKISHPQNIIVDLGLFTSYSKDSLLFYYDILKQEIPLLKDTALLIHEIPGKIQCNTCKHRSALKDPYMVLCPLCHSSDVAIVSGREFMLREIETAG